MLPVEFCEKMAKTSEWLNWLERMESDDKIVEIWKNFGIYEDLLLRLWVDSIPSVMDVSSLTSLPSYGLDVTVDMLTTSSDVKWNADNVHISFGSYARREMGKGEIRGKDSKPFFFVINPI